MKKLSNNDIADLACENGLEYAALNESGGIGFDERDLMEKALVKV